MAFRESLVLSTILAVGATAVIAQQTRPPTEQEIAFGQIDENKDEPLCAAIQSGGGVPVSTATTNLAPLVGVGAGVLGLAALGGGGSTSSTTSTTGTN